MNSDQQEKIAQKARQEILAYLEAALPTVCWNKEQASSAFKEGGFAMSEGVVFATTPESSRCSLLMAKAIVEAAGVDLASVRETRDVATKTLAQALKESDANADITAADLFKQYSDAIVVAATTSFSYIAPCEVIEFDECEPCLTSRFLRIRPARAVIDEVEMPKSGKDWELISVEDSWPTEMPREFATIYGVVWDVACDAPKDLARQSARWMCEVFLSAIRVGLRPADYCHRARIGDVEPDPFSQLLRYERGLSYSPDRFQGGGSRRIKTYKVDKDFADRFHAEGFQSKFDLLLGPSRNSVAERMANAMGWAARGRQAEDNSERLLHHFTALEALFAENSAGAPVVDTIARFAGVVLSEKPEWRENTFREIKKLYALRSDLVHRGARKVHWLNANNLQRITEDILFIVLENVPLEQTHAKFVNELRSATHGGQWPKEG